MKVENLDSAGIPAHWTIVGGANHREQPIDATEVGSLPGGWRARNMSPMAEPPTDAGDAAAHAPVGLQLHS
jgi:uncharacterized protein YbdZ (MbtH family)